MIRRNFLKSHLRWELRRMRPPSAHSSNTAALSHLRGGVDSNVWKVSVVLNDVRSPGRSQMAAENSGGQERILFPVTILSSQSMLAKHVFFKIG